MAELTKNFGLIKPLPEEFYDVNVFNENMNKIDEELNDLSKIPVTSEVPEDADIWIDPNDEATEETHIMDKNNPHGVTAEQVGAVTKTLLWENESVTIEFASHYIVIDSFTDYDGFEIVYYDRIYESKVLYSSGYMPMVLNQQYRLTADYIGSGDAILHRTVEFHQFSGGSGMQFSNGYYRNPDAMGSGNVDNEYIIPYQIYGIKGVRNGNDSGSGNQNTSDTKKPLVLYGVRDNDYPQMYLNDPTYGDEALEAILNGRQILVRTPNADMLDSVDGGYTVHNAALFSPVLTYHLPNYENEYLYLFYLRDEKQAIDLSAVGMGVIQIPVYGQLKMKLSKVYNECPLEHKTANEYGNLINETVNGGVV